MLMLVIDGIRPVCGSRELDRLQCCWHVGYQFCGLSAEITVSAENKLRRVPRRSINFASAV